MTEFIQTPRQRWNFKKKAGFALSYLWSKLVLPTEIRKPKLRMLEYELRYSLTNLINTLSPDLLPQALYYGPEEIQTADVRYKVRAGTHDAALVSPAFEKADRFEMKKRIQEELQRNSEVGFLDIGANIGAFCVPLAKEFSTSPLKVWAFEPIPANRDLLQANLKLNQIENVEVFPYALGNTHGTAEITFSKTRPGDSNFTSSASASKEHLQVPLRTADELFSEVPKVLFIKIDVEGQEQSVLEGMTKLLTHTQRCWLCIEDIFHRESLWTYLESRNFKFISKSTPYNSWWLLSSVSDSK